MDKPRKIVFATNNSHKLSEARQILGEDFEIVSLADIGCHDEIPETADTFEGNALIKARWIRDKYGLDCFADDTGLIVDSLGGAPGVYSARYAGPACNSVDNMRKLLDEMKDKSDRKARFRTVVALAYNGEEHCFEGKVEGEISREPHGEGGFGYDPVFVPEETGVSFAEMGAEAKNAISHRGRAMRKLRDFLCVVSVILAVFFCGGKATAQQWRLHASYDGQMERIIDTPDYVYFLGASQYFDPTHAYMKSIDGVLMRYDKKGDELRVLNSQNLLSATTVVAIEYNFQENYLLVAYDDGNIDLLYDDDTLVNVPGLKMSSVSKTVHSVTIDESRNLAYLATDFGYVTVDGARGEVGTSRMLNAKLNSVLAKNGDLWVASGGKILTAKEGETDLSKFTTAAEIADVFRLRDFGKRGVLVEHGKRNSKIFTLVSTDGEGWKTERLVNVTGNSLEKSKSGYVCGAWDGVTVFSENGESVRYIYLDSDKNSYVASYNEKDFWFSGERKGISQKRREAGTKNWTVLKDNFFPNVSSAFMCTSMAYSPEYGMLVRNHSMDRNFNTDKGNYIDVNDLISAYKDMTWKRVSTTYAASDYPGLQFKNPRGVAIDPNNPDHVYSGSVLHGLLRLDLSNPANSIHMSKPSDVSNGNGHTGFAVIAEDSPQGAFWDIRCLFSAPAFDSKGRMWATYTRPRAEDSSGADIELWYWTAEDRAATTSWQNVRPFGKLVIKGEKISNIPALLPLKTSGNQNYIIVQGNLTGGPLIVYDHNGTPDDTSDDRMAKVLTLYDQDGAAVDHFYGYAHYEDPSTGQVWYSTGSDLVVFTPSEMFTNPGSVKRIKVPRNDGTNLADYLLNGVMVNQIITTPDGNKWYATGGAGLMSTTSDGREVLQTYNTDNSEIPSDVVYSICYNPETNSIMTSTSKGLAELFLSGTSAGSKQDVKVYPNPVRPDYHGYVHVEGLPSEAMVKVVDAGGNLVKECGAASAGEAKWDLTNLGYKRVPGGVYFIIASNGANSDSYNKVGKVLVIE